MRNKMIPLFWPPINSKVRRQIIRELKKVFKTRWIGQGPKVDEFEIEFGKKFGYEYPLFVNSGTSALELAYYMIGIKEGDEVITTCLSCTATNIPLLRRGAKIVFADIEKGTLNIDPMDVRRKITPKTRAIVAVNLGGIPVDEDVFQIGREYKIPIVTDSAQMHLPTNGDYIMYSLQSIKHVSTGDGGILVLKNRKLYRRAKLLRWFGIDREEKAKRNWQAWERRQMTFDIKEAGFKYQPNDIMAAIGLVSLKNLDFELKHREELATEYKKGLFPLIANKKITVISGGSNWLFGILVEDRDEFAEYLTKNGIENNLVHLRNDSYEIFRDFKTHCPNMDWIESRYLYLPINIKVTKRGVKYITGKIIDYYESRN